MRHILHNRIIYIFYLALVVVFNSCDHGSHGGGKSNPPNPIFTQLIGVDYQANHYPQGDARNGENQSNVKAELAQLKNAGFYSVRLYDPPAKTWIAVINAANETGMKIVYQLALCQTHLPPTDNTCLDNTTMFSTLLQTEQTKLNNVIAAVGSDVFKRVVPLVIAGNEIYSSSTSGSFSSNISNLVDAINAAQTILKNNGLEQIPVSISLQADVWIAGYNFSTKIPDQSNSIYLDFKNKLLPALNKINITPPIGFNVYPFQWGLIDAQKAVDSSDTAHSLAWYLEAINKMYPNNESFISETGWATDGNYPSVSGNIVGNLNQSSIYLSNLYKFITDQSKDFKLYQTVPVFTFMAFDVPTKSTDPSLSSENHYGVFDQECALKNSTKTLLPNPEYSYTPQCSDQNAIFTFIGGSNTAQPLFTIEYTHNGQKNTFAVPTQNRKQTQQDITPWPTITLAPGDTVTLISSTNTTKRCSNVVKTINTSNHSGGTWENANTSAPDICSGVNWGSQVTTGQDVYFPSDF